MNREERIRREIPGAPEDVILQLAGKPLAEVDVIVAALRQARRDGIQHEKDLRRQRREEARKFRWYDEGELAERNARLIRAGSRRAAESLEALRSLTDMVSHAHTAIELAVEGLRARGFSDTEIGSALGITRQAVGQHYGRRREADGLSQQETA